MGFEPMNTGLQVRKTVYFHTLTENIGQPKSLKRIDGNLHHGLKMGWSSGAWPGRHSTLGIQPVLSNLKLHLRGINRLSTKEKSNLFSRSFDEPIWERGIRFCIK